MKMRAISLEGFADRTVSRNGPYDLIMANILAGPLRRMAADLTRNLRPGGQLILSGLLHHQVQQLVGDYLARKLTLEMRLDWITGVVWYSRKGREADNDSWVQHIC